MSSRDEAQAWTPSDDGIDDLEIDHQRYDPQAGRGFTELLWESETEEFRFYWEYFSRIIALLSGYFVVKTNIIYIDISLSVILTTYLMSVIETQRSYGGLSEKTRERFYKLSITLPSLVLIPILRALVLIKIARLTCQDELVRLLCASWHTVKVNGIFQNAEGAPPLVSEGFFVFLVLFFGMSFFFVFATAVVFKLIDFGYISSLLRQPWVEAFFLKIDSVFVLARCKIVVFEAAISLICLFVASNIAILINFSFEILSTF